jgi:serine/threonine protein kinase
MQVRCTQCRHPIEISGDTSFDDVTCPNCGSDVNLAGYRLTETHGSQPRELAHFRLLEVVGSGAFGDVWRAQDTRLDRQVAIKIPRRDRLNPQEQEQFLREARAAAQLRHPNIVSVHEVGQHGETAYIVSDYVRGGTLADWLDSRPPDSNQAAEWCRKIAQALHHAHEAGVIHRDLKPSNIMIDLQGEPHLMDFGLAKREAGEERITHDGRLLGTPAYMSPEQAQGNAHHADRRSDIYSLGVILFELLTRELPFQGNTRMLVVQILTSEPPGPRKLNKLVPRDLETITLKCLEKEPHRRYATAAEVSDDLTRFLSYEPIRARPIGHVERAWRLLRRNWMVTILLLAIFVVLTIQSPIVSGAVLLFCGFAVYLGSRPRLGASDGLNKPAELASPIDWGKLGQDVQEIFAAALGLAQAKGQQLVSTEMFLEAARMRKHASILKLAGPFPGLNVVQANPEILPKEMPKADRPVDNAPAVPEQDTLPTPMLPQDSGSTFHRYRAGDKPVGPYRLIRKLGHGAFGDVWLASAPGGTEVALKFIDLTGQQGLREFKSLRLVKKITHNNLTPLYGLWLKNADGTLIGESDALSEAAATPTDSTSADAPATPAYSKPVELIVAMGYAKRSLFDRLRECKTQGLVGIPADELLDYMEDAARGIDFLNRPIHDTGHGPVPIIHSNIKPQNILIVGNCAQVSDIEMAITMEGFQATGAAPFTLAYAAPEVFRRKLSDRSDQYSLAITYVELRTGALPFDESLNGYEVMQAHVRGELDLSRLTPPEAAIIRKATAVFSEDRWRDCRAMVNELRRALRLSTDANFMTDVETADDPAARQSGPQYDHTAAPPGTGGDTTGVSGQTPTDRAPPITTRMPPMSLPTVVPPLPPSKSRKPSWLGGRRKHSKGQDRRAWKRQHTGGSSRATEKSPGQDNAVGLSRTLAQSLERLSKELRPGHKLQLDDLVYDMVRFGEGESNDALRQLGLTPEAVEANAKVPLVKRWDAN